MEPLPSDVSDAQLESIHSLHSQMIQDSELLRAQLRIQRQKQMDLLSVAEIDADKVHSAQSEINALQSKLENLMIDHRIAVSKILTKEQRERMHSKSLRRMMCAGGGPPPPELAVHP